MHFMHTWPAVCVKGGFARNMGKENAFETFGWLGICVIFLNMGFAPGVT
jgi:hypothetical protein